MQRSLVRPASHTGSLLRSLGALRCFFENPDLRPEPREGGEASGAAPRRAEVPLRRRPPLMSVGDARTAARRPAFTVRRSNAALFDAVRARSERGGAEVVGADVRPANDGGGWFFMRFRSRMPRASSGARSQGSAVDAAWRPRLVRAAGNMKCIYN